MARDKRPRVVIVGGGFAGRKARSVLQKYQQIDSVVLEALQFMEYTPSVLRCLVESTHITHVLLPTTDKRVLHGYASAIEQDPSGGGSVLCSDGSRLPFDALLLATGSSYSAPIRPAASPAVDPQGAAHPHEHAHAAASDAAGAGGCSGGGEPLLPPAHALAARTAELHAAADRLKAADSVAVVGGGTVGVELAAEIAGRFGGTKAVTLITSQSRLLDRLPPAAGAYAERWLRARGVTLLFGARVTRWPRGPQRTSHGGAARQAQQVQQTQQARQPAAGSSERGAEEEEDGSGGGGGALHTSCGTEVLASLVYDCTGGRCRGAHLYHSLRMGGGGGGDDDDKGEGGGGADEVTRHPWLLHKRGIPVDDTLLVHGCTSVFACGDAMASEFEKTAYTAELSAELAARNIAALLLAPTRKCTASTAEARPRLLRWPADLPRLSSTAARRPPTVQCISLYKWDGILQFNGLMQTGLAAASQKWALEFVLLRVARGSWPWVKLWGLAEYASTVLGSVLFTGGGSH